MRALTVYGCWAWAITDRAKDIENRTWEPPIKHVGTRIAIHAGSNSGGPDAEYLRECDPAGAPARWPASVVVATCTLAGAVFDDRARSLGRLTPELRARARSSAWFGGPVGWVLTDLVKLPRPVPCKGKLGLWELPSDVARAVCAQLQAPAMRGPV